MACTPYFKRELQKLGGVKEVKPIVMMNTIDVEIDPEAITLDKVKQEILLIASKAGFGGKVKFIAKA